MLGAVPPRAVSMVMVKVRAYRFVLFPTHSSPSISPAVARSAATHVYDTIPVVPDDTSASTVSVGTADVFGFPLRADAFAYVPIYWNNTLITASTGFVAAVTTDPATVSTGDVRGTYAVQTASDDTKKLQVFWRPNAANISQVGQFGVAQA